MLIYQITQCTHIIRVLFGIIIDILSILLTKQSKLVWFPLFRKIFLRLLYCRKRRGICLKNWKKIKSYSYFHQKTKNFFYTQLNTPSKRKDHFKIALHFRGSMKQTLRKFFTSALLCFKVYSQDWNFLLLHFWGDKSLQSCQLTFLCPCSLYDVYSKYWRGTFDKHGLSNYIPI